jgi:alkylated DNA repair dioxygenase AlkB
LSGTRYAFNLAVTSLASSPPVLFVTVRMTQQRLNFGDRDEPPLEAPPGLIFVLKFLDSRQESTLLDSMRSISFASFKMRGVTARRRVAHFGLHYSFPTNSLTSARAIPAWLLPIRERAAIVAGIASEQFEEALVTEYAPGAGIGWHRDAPPFGIVCGISLGAACRMRFRHRADHRRTLALPLPPGSLYVMTGEARSDWEHMIPPVKQARYSMTFRTLRRKPD